MKGLELNAHYIIEENCNRKIKECVQKIISEQPYTFFLKGVSQSSSSPRLVKTDNLGYVPCKMGHAMIRLDNHALSVAEMLKREGFPYKWTWIPSKVDHGQFEKGVAVFCRESMEEAEQFIFWQQEMEIKETIYE